MKRKPIAISEDNLPQAVGNIVSAGGRGGEEGASDGRVGPSADIMKLKEAARPDKPVAVSQDEQKQEKPEAADTPGVEKPRRGRPRKTDRPQVAARPAAKDSDGRAAESSQVVVRVPAALRLYSKHVFDMGETGRSRYVRQMLIDRVVEGANKGLFGPRAIEELVRDGILAKGENGHYVQGGYEA